MKHELLREEEPDKATKLAVRCVITLMGQSTALRLSLTKTKGKKSVNYVISSGAQRSREIYWTFFFLPKKAAVVTMSMCKRFVSIWNEFARDGYDKCLKFLRIKSSDC